MNIELNKNKRIGKVLFIVEGEKTEFNILHKIFTKIFDYQYESHKRSGKYKIYNKKDDPFSSIFVINSKQVQMKSLNDYEYLEELYVKLQDEYKFPVENASIYYIFDRDVETNPKVEIIEELIDKLNNSKESDTFDIQGLLLLSYPSIEAFITSNFIENTFEEEFDLGKNLKRYCHDNHCSHQKINEDTLKLSIKEMHGALDIMEISSYDLDDFAKTNKQIFNFQESNYKKNKKYRLLSLLCIALIDLGLIEIEE